MPVETGRIVNRKRVKLPSGSTVDIPVIGQITFLDVVNQAQESQFHLDNSAASKRDVHVATLPGGGDASDETGSGSDSDLKVERIDVWRMLDVVEQGQETFFHPDNKTVQKAPDAPPYFVTHEKTHVVKYINTPDDGNWIKAELIDQCKYADTVEQGQETEYFLFNPPDNAGIAGLTLGTDSDGKPTVAIDPGLPDVTGADGIDPPWRLDPFQNIVDFSRAGGAFVCGTRGQQLGPASYFSSPDGFTWTAFADAFAVAGASFSDGSIGVIAGHKKAFLIAGSGEGFFGDSSTAGLLLASTDNGQSWDDVTPANVAAGGGFGEVFYDFNAATPAFRVEARPFGAAKDFQSSYDDLQTWVSEGSARPSFWNGNKSNTFYAKGLDPQGNKIFIYVFKAAIWLTQDAGTGLPPVTPVDANGNPPLPWFKVYSAPDDGTQLGGPVVASYSGAPSTDLSGNPQAGSTFVTTGGIKQPSDGTNAWSNKGPADLFIFQVVLPWDPIVRWALMYPDANGALLHTFTAGSPPFYTPPTYNFGTVDTDLHGFPPTPATVGAWFVQSSTGDFWIYETTGSGPPVSYPVVFVSVGGYAWKIIKLGTPPDRPATFAIACGDTTTIPT